MKGAGGYDSKNYSIVQGEGGEDRESGKGGLKECCADSLYIYKK